MAAKATLELCILFEDELRKAAKLLKQFDEVAESKYATDAEKSAAAATAFKACRLALWGISDTNVVMVSSGQLQTAITDTIKAAKRIKRTRQ